MERCQVERCNKDKHELAESEVIDTYLSVACRRHTETGCGRHFKCAVGFAEKSAATMNNKCDFSVVMPRVFSGMVQWHVGCTSALV